MPQLPTPATPATPIDTGDLPVSSIADVKAVWPAEDNQSLAAPVRDAVQQAELALCLEYQRQRRYAAAQSDPLRATGAYADEAGGFERGVFRQPGEIDSAYRSRYLSFPSIVDPNDILLAANAQLAPFTSVPCRYAEGLDGVFANDPGNVWSSHAFDALVGGPHEVPNYPDRYYPDTVAFGLVAIPNRRPPGAMVTDPGGRWFLLRVPDISGIDAIVSSAYDSAPADGSGFFVTDGSGTFGGEFPFDFSATSTAVYNALISSVSSIIGQSIRWSLVVDSLLTA